MDHAFLNGENPLFEIGDHLIGRQRVIKELQVADGSREVAEW